ncbi:MULTISPECIES: response regulator transcription factor [Paenibacillus]|uniref:Response regulator containing CheY-like receiver domain and AraC-type DNA-binding domain n=1 Tax=Paenibacillus barengoltzii J12 TaxID=935846 RepID=A0ABY1LTB5_9BACL|nr:MULTISPECIES: response regulator transcription factor [Paenibacillus]MDU0330327.1 helix-turn-helix domain-containing protein [Paenibacillus sp. 3LSP]SME99232.1 Response regulator containing CheY-like receiver domain and AraC-type DNA-binding domain [Paenibacillus barengoltzii J12]
MHKALVVDLAPHHAEYAEDRPDWNGLKGALHHCIRSSSSVIPLLSNNRYTVVIIHVFKANDEGMKLCEQIRYFSQLPIIITGGSTDFYWARKAVQLQVNDYLPAPFSMNELNSSLQGLANPKEDSLDISSLNDRLDAISTLKQDPVIDAVKEYVKNAMDQSITLKEIAEKMHFNYSYLVQKFKIHEKMTFSEYLLVQRMEKAKSLLVQTDMKIHEIAENVGYRDLDWFYKKFKAHTGVNANLYRKMQSRHRLAT